MEQQAFRPRVLIVDDEPTNLTVLREILKGRYTVLAATSGADAIAAATADPPPDLILLDVVMPGMDGYEVLKALRSSPSTRGMKVVFVTAKDAVEDKTKAYGLGVEDYITKPVDPDFALRIVERIVKV